MVVYIHLPYSTIEQKIVIRTVQVKQVTLLTISLGQQSLVKLWFTNKIPFTSQLHHSESYTREMPCDKVALIITRCDKYTLLAMYTELEQ